MATEITPAKAVPLEGIAALAFDLDGTLIDSAPGIAASLRQAFYEAGCRIPEVDLRTVVGPPVPQMARRVDPALTDDQVAAITRAFRSHYDGEGWRQSVLFSGVEATLRGLRRADIRLFVVTNKPQLPTANILAHLGLTDLFEAVFTRDCVTPPYPSKQAMLAALLAEHDLAPNACAMVGDTSEDGEAARAHGMAHLYVTYGYGEPAPGAIVVDRLAAIATSIGKGETE